MKARSVFFTTLFVANLLSLPAISAQLPPQYVNNVVAIGTRILAKNPDGSTELRWATEGTGFFYGYLVHDDPDPAKRGYEIYLVTARHVVEEHVANLKSDLNIRLNPKDPTKSDQEFSLPNQPPPGAATWFFHPNKTIDVAVVPISFQILREQGFDPGFFNSDETSINSKKLRELEVSAGDGIFVLGFPMNLAGAQKNYVIVRQGVIARVSEMLDGASTTFMVDSHVFPGNSGGPVILKGELASVVGTKIQNRAFLIGLVISYVPYNDTAVSTQTGQARVIFQENSGLAEVLPTDYIDQTIEAYRATEARKPTAGPEKH